MPELRETAHAVLLELDSDRANTCQHRAARGGKSLIATDALSLLRTRLVELKRVQEAVRSDGASD